MARLRRAASRPQSLGLGLVVLALVACESSPGQVRQWRPQDHNHAQEPGSPGPRADDTQGVPAANSAAAAAEDNVVLAAWDRHCARCHGAQGRGDGPQGAMMGAPDLTRASFQATVTDEQIRATIRRGRGRMPPFSLPDATVEGLTRWIRAQRQTPAAASPGAAPSAMPGAANGPTPAPQSGKTPAAP